MLLFEQKLHFRAGLMYIIVTVNKSDFCVYYYFVIDFVIVYWEPQKNGVKLVSNDMFQ